MILNKNNLPTNNS